MKKRVSISRSFAALVLLAGAAFAQERAGEAQIGFQYYSLTNGQQRVSNAMGLTLGFREFFPRVGVVSVNLAPATSNGRFQTGTSFAELKQLPWAKQYWTFRGGDFRLSGRLIEVPFNNLFYPDIAGRGGLIEASHGGRTMGLFYGSETLQAGVRVPLRLITPQTMAGAYYRQKFGDRLILGGRLMRLTTDLNKLRQTPQISLPIDPIRDASTGMVNALFTIAGPLKWYSEAAISESSRELPTSPRRGGPLSITSGPLLETDRFTFRANYVHQNDSYLPLLGYFLGDRRGPFTEIKVRPFSRLELYGSVSQYRNNVARNPLRATFRSTTESAGLSLQLPSRFTLSGQWSEIKLVTRKSDADPWEDARTNQLQLTLARPIGRHSARISVRELQQRNIIGSMRQRTLELADTFQYKWMSLGAEVRGQQLAGPQSKTSIFVRGNAQLNWSHLSLYANVESGNDLANRTLFATSTMNSTVLGANARVGRDWDFSLEAYRNKLVSELNPENVFVLQGQGVYVPSVLAALNQWSLYFRASKRLSWGKPIPTNIVSLDNYSVVQNPLKGSVEGFVRGDHRRGVEGIPVALDGVSTILTDATGRFRFEGVGEGARRVGLALDELPAEYDPGRTIASTVLVKPGAVSRVDLEVVVVGYAIQGTVTGPAGTPLNEIILKLLPSDRYTTADKNGRFSFYNLKSGDYAVAIDETTLPEFAVLKTPAKVSLTLGGEQESSQPRFAFDIQEPPKPVMRVAVAPKVVELPRSVEQRVEPIKPPEVRVEVAPPGAVAVPAPSAPRQRAALPPPPKRVPESVPARGTAEQLYQRGRQLSDAEDFPEAIAVLTQAIDARPDNPLAFNTRGFSYMKLSRFREAVADFTEAIRLNPNYKNAYQNRSAAKRRLGDIAGAQADADMAKTLK